MAAEVNSREHVSVGEEKNGSGRSNRSPRKVRASAGRARSPEQVHTSVKHEGGYGVRTSVLQGKVKALKEKHMKERKGESIIVECQGGEGNNAEDALVTLQLRTYLTEDLLDCTKHGRFSGAQQDGWRPDELWETCSSEGSSVPCCSGCKIANPSSHNQDTDSSSVKSQDRMSSSSDNRVDVSPSASKCNSVSIPLAERVEKNRQELRSKFGKTAYHAGKVTHGGEPDQTQLNKNGSLIITHNAEDDPGVSLPVTEECGELSIRHEQAKQLLQRARMKAKGAAPLRASHCVLPNPHSQQPTLYRGPSYSGVLTDGGSLSDSSSSDHCSLHKGSRGSSPSHVRFQDESEREAEERYRERQQVPQTSPVIATPPQKRPSNGLVSLTEQLSSSGHGQCGTCGQAPSPAAIHGTNLRNVHLGSKIAQDGSVNSPLGVKPSPHWILPSQPWRVHTELIRETHIGGDSTPDSSGDDDGHRTHSKKSRDSRMHKHCRSNTAHSTSEQGGKLHLCSENTLQEGSSHSKNGTSAHIVQKRLKSYSNLSEHVSKTSETNPDMGTAARSNCADSVRTSSRKLSEMTNSTQKNKRSTPESGVDLNASDQEIGTGGIVLNVDTVEGKYQTISADARTPVMPPVVSSHGLSGHVPVPPTGKASAMVLSRSRLTLRSGIAIQELNIPHKGDMVQTCLDIKHIQSNPVPNARNSIQETVAPANNCELSSQDLKSKEHKSRERSQKSKKHPEDRKTKDSKENRDSMKHHLLKEQRDNGGPYTSSRQKDYDKHLSSRDQRGKDCVPSDLSREQERSDMNYSKRDEKYTKMSGTNGQWTYSNNANTGLGKCSQENSFTCHTTSPIISTKDRNLELVDEGSLQPVPKKGDLRSGMRKIFSSIGLASRPKMERFHSTSLEQIFSTDRHGRKASADGDNESYDGSLQPGKIKKSPSLQSLKLMSPFHLPRKASSVQNLTGKSDRSAAYVTGDVSTAPRRALSVEDIGSPGKARALGKVAELFPDGTRLLELQRPDNGTFGFRISSVSGRPDSGIYVQEMSDASTAKLYSGLLRVGDEILEVNGAKVSTLGQAHLTELLNREAVLSLRVLHQRRTQC